MLGPRSVDNREKKWHPNKAPEELRKAMSLALLQSYSSAEEEEEEAEQVHLRYNSSDEDGDDENDRREASASLSRPISDGSFFDLPNPSSNASGLPSAFDAFSEVYLFLFSPSHISFFFFFFLAKSTNYSVCRLRYTQEI